MVSSQESPQTSATEVISGTRAASGSNGELRVGRVPSITLSSLGRRSSAGRTRPTGGLLGGEREKLGGKKDEEKAKRL